MTIDWITVSAQIINFLILVWLLKRFLYHPVIRAMERREQRIADRLNETQEREQQADKKSQQYQDKTEELERQRGELISQAKAEAEQQKKQLLNEAREEISEKRANWQRQANEEKEEFLTNLRRQAAQGIQTIARKALRDLADAGLEAQIVAVFLNRLKTLDKETRKALEETSEPVRIISTFELDSAVRGRLTRTIHEHLADGIEVDYTESPELLCGIKLSRGSQRLSWNLADYMEELEASINKAFSPTASEPQSEEA